MNYKLDIKSSAVLLIFLILVSSVIFLIVFPYSSNGNLYTFREDNFWSYSSGFCRRASVGEIIYILDTFTGLGPLVLTMMYCAIFIISALFVFYSICEAFSLLEIILLSLTPFVLLYMVDGEVLMLLPLLAMGMQRSGGRNFIVLVLIAFAISARELALLLYSPALLILLVRGHPIIRVAVVLVLAAFCTSFSGLCGPPSFVLETTYWPDRGVTMLTDSQLYKFAEKSLSDVLALHLKHIGENALLGGIQWFALATTFMTYIAWQTQQPLTVLWFLVIYAFASVLSIDHGRYAYFFFFFTILMARPASRDWFRLNDLGIPSAASIERAIAPAVGYMSAARRWLLPVSLFVLVIGPSAFVISQTQLMPRFLVYPLKALEKLGFIS